MSPETVRLVVTDAANGRPVMFGFISHAVGGLALLALGCPVLGLCLIGSGAAYLIGDGDEE